MKLPSRALGAALKVAHDTAHIAPIVAFLFITSIPSESLAFVNNIEAPSKPLEFIMDDELANTAIIGIDAWPSTNEWLASTTSRIPDITITPAPNTTIHVIATAYSSDQNQTDSNPLATASGTRVHSGTLAANFLPFGARVKIGAVTYTVEDRLNARYNNKAIVDVWQPSRDMALQFGVRSLDITIVSLP